VLNEFPVRLAITSKSDYTCLASTKVKGVGRGR